MVRSRYISCSLPALYGDKLPFSPLFLGGAGQPLYREPWALLVHLYQGSSVSLNILQPLLPVLHSPGLLRYSQGSVAAISVLINLLGSIRSVLQGQGKFENIHTNNKRFKVYWNPLLFSLSSSQVTPLCLSIYMYIFLILMLIMLNIPTQTDKVIPNEL